MIDGEGIINRALRSVTGERTSLITNRSKDSIEIKMRVKKMAADRIIPDSKGEPPARIKGKFEREFSYAGGAVNLKTYENGVLLDIKGYAKPEWFERNRKNDAFTKAALIRDYIRAGGERIPKRPQALETAIKVGIFEGAAEGIRPDSKRLPSERERGLIVRRFPYRGVTLTEYKNGVLLLLDSGEVEWYNRENKRRAYDKAKFISNSIRSKRIFRD